MPALLVLPQVVPAHGVGNRQDLPLPFPVVVIGACVALVLSFAALAFLWRTPRFHDDYGRPVGAVLSGVLDSRWIRTVARVLAAALTVLTLAALVAGSDDATNPSAYVIFVWLWIGLPFLSLLFGPIWPVINPARWMHTGICRLIDTDPAHGLATYRLGYWPAAALLYAFAWLELIAPDRTTRPVLGVAVLAFALISLVASLTFGRTWFRSGDPFEVISRLYGSMSPVGRRPDRTWVLRHPLSGLSRIRSERGLLATVSVMLGSTAYDGFAGIPAWYGYAQSSSVPQLTQTAGLLGFCVLIAGSLALAAAIAARISRAAVSGVPTDFATSLVPIAAGYVVAHYWSLLVFGGQVALSLLSDPLGIGANWLGTRGLKPATALIDPVLVATIQALAIIAGHILGIVAAHERALTRFGGKAAVLGQIPLLVVMVGYTAGGLLLLFAG